MSSDTHHRVAVELGFPEELVKYALKKHKFKTAGDFIEYLELNEKALIVLNEKDATPEELAKVVEVEVSPAKTQKTLRQETEDLYHRSICLNCLDKKRSIVTLPCSHFTLCALCVKRVRKCPLRDCCADIECSISYVQSLM